ncbi:SSI family serine proteinase inhibitor [Streptomyces sp. 549]|uniref:SSI family serine proteinase inhibitor n=1 Tax=Streptomyces sp. 549 TaxID=3049076 RepID=UPI0024C3CE4E|nr:SSI family serine proteinase inhibitor [Streptomyces sp. 549]MDK1474954.1 SSI family serine proteinase inhibitor [Streptomyces sp. 549]
MLRRLATTLAVTAAVSGIASPALACPPPGGEDKLTITYREHQDAAERVHTLECHPAGGTHPAAQEACDALDNAVRGVRNPWQPVSKDAMCTQAYGGPQTARVTGTWSGRPVKADFSRTNGCEVARWDSVTPALPAV